MSKQLRWQVGVQRELARRHDGLDAAYVGNYGYDIEITRNLNALPNQYLNTDNSRNAAMNANNAFLTASVANPFAGLLPGTSFNNPTIARRQLLLPYPAFGSVNTTNNDGKSWYHAGQFGLQKRFSKGYAVGVSYTYSNWMQATEYLNAADPTPTKMISDLDVTHRLSISGIYELPFGKGQEVRCRMRAGSPRRSSAAGRFRASTPTRPASRSRSATMLLQRRRHRARRTRTTSRWFNTVAFTSFLTDPSTNIVAGRPPAHDAAEVRRRPQGSDQQLRPVAHQDTRLRGTCGCSCGSSSSTSLNYANFNVSNVNVTMTSTAFGTVSASNQDNYARRAQVGVKFLF